MSEPWAEFRSRAARHEHAGYFEAAEPGVAGRATVWSFRGADRVVRVRSSRDLDRLAAGEPGNNGTLGYLGFDAGHLFDPLIAPRTGGPFPLGEFAQSSDVRPLQLSVRAPPRGRRHGRTDRRPDHDTLPRSRFERSVVRLRHRIAEGHAFQVVLSHRRRWPRPDLLEVADRLRRSERYAYFYYLKFGDREIVGASPESVLEVRRGVASIHPIAGTRPLPGAPGRRPLTADPKELAEHRMLVDLARNDLGRIARVGSVEIAWSERPTRYARLEHLVSRVTGRLAPDVGPWQALGAAFPAGTVSGAPKVRATALLRAEEATWRGPYGGAVGLVAPGGEARWALAIRSAFAAGPHLYTAAGAGIVWGSTPRREWEETIAKLAVLEEAVAGGDRP